MANWEARAAKKKDVLCDDTCGATELTFLCTMACFMPWAKFISMPGSADDTCCVKDSSGGFHNVENTSVSTNRSVVGDKRYIIKESMAIASHHLSRNNSVIKSSDSSISSKLRNQQTSPEPRTSGPKSHGIKDL
eukprot:gene11117-23230_t